jgi:hypothetical protein
VRSCRYRCLADHCRRWRGYASLASSADKASLHLQGCGPFRHAPGVTAVIAGSLVLSRSPSNGHSLTLCSAQPAGRRCAGGASGSAFDSTGLGLSRPSRQIAEVSPRAFSGPGLRPMRSSTAGVTDLMRELSAAPSPAPPAPSVPKHKAWMPHPCCSNNMAGTSTPYPRPEQRPPGVIRSHRSHSGHSTNARPRTRAPTDRFRINAPYRLQALYLAGNNKSGRRESNPHSQLGRLAVCSAGLVRGHEKVPVAALDRSFDQEI